MSLNKYRFIKFFEEVRSNDVNLVGGKNASLGELLSFGIPVPLGFAVTAKAFDYVLESNDVLYNNKLISLKHYISKLANSLIFIQQWLIRQGDEQEATRFARFFNPHELPYRKRLNPCVVHNHAIWQDEFIETLFIVNDFIAQNNSILFIRIDPSTVDKNQMAVFENELQTLPEQRTEDLKHILLRDSS